MIVVYDVSNSEVDPKEQAKIKEFVKDLAINQENQEKAKIINNYYEQLKKDVEDKIIVNEQKNPKQPKI